MYLYFMKVKIYCLYDAIECKIRYIGRTSKKVLEHRLIEHITKAKYHEKYKPGKKISHKDSWIRRLLKQNQEPKIKFLIEIEGWKESHQFERGLIKKYKDKFDLTNHDDRGEGSKNHNISEEDKINISNSLKKYFSNNKNVTSKETYGYDLQGNFVKKWESCRKAALELKYPTSKVNMVCLGQIPKYKNYIFSYFCKNPQPYIRKRKKVENVKQRVYFRITDLLTNEEFIIHGASTVAELCEISVQNIYTFIRLYKGIYKKKWKFEKLVQYKSDELLEPHSEMGNQQPS